MITYDELYESLESTGFPVAYHHFSNPPDLPYIVFLREKSASMEADNLTYLKLDDWMVEIYTEQKDFNAETDVEKALDKIGAVYTTTEGYLDTEKMYLIRYEFGG